VTRRSVASGPLRVLKDLKKTGGERLEEEVYRRALKTGATHVAEFPKSGGTWIRAMIIDAYSRSALGRPPRVIHHHWPYRDAYHPAIHLVRDGRDVVISLYHHNARLIRSGSYWAPRVSAHFAAVLGPDYDLEDVERNLPPFIRGLRIAPFGGFLRPRRRRQFLSWPDHTANWYGRASVPTARYEDFLEAPQRELARVTRHLGLSLDEVSLDSIVARHSFEVAAGRARGSEDRSSFLRRGVAGEWKDLFSDEARSEFLAYGGSTLISLGYEPDDLWAGVDRRSTS
jgi:sulfotransferase family protein